MQPMKTLEQGRVFLVPHGNHIKVISAGDIVYVQADNNYSVFILDDGSEYTLCKTLEFVETTLDAENFFRCHKSYLVNLLKIKEITKGKIEITMQDGRRIPVARRKRSDFLKAVLGATRTAVPSKNDTVHQAKVTVN